MKMTQPKSAFSILTSLTSNKPDPTCKQIIMEEESQTVKIQEKRSPEKQNDMSEEETISSAGEATVVVPPDGGWGWVIVFASFCCNVIVDGIIFSFGMFLTDISSEFRVTKAEVTLVGSLLSGFYLMAGPFVSALANKYGFRLVAILGSIIGSIAFVLSAYSTSVEYLFISYGVLGGIGFGLIYVPAVITVGFYFEKWRALATGIAVCGSGLGTFILAPFSAFLVESFGWRHALLVQAALVLCCGVFGALFRPIKPVKLTVESASNSEFEIKTKTDELALLNNRNLRTLQEHSESANSLGSMISLNSKTVPVRSNYNYPTAKEVLGLGRPVLQHPAVTMLSKSEKKLNNPVMVENLKLAAGNLEFRPKREHEPLIEESKTPIERRHTMGEKYFNKDVYRKTTIPKVDDVIRPFYRDDIFFSASLQRLPQYTSHTSLGYHLSVTRLPTKIDLIEEKEAKCKLCPESIHRILNTMLDLTLLKSPSFLLLAFSGFFTMMGFYVPFMYLTDRATLSGMEVGVAMWLVSIIGIANTVGRILCGVLTSFPGCNGLIINNIAITIAGVATMLSNFSTLDESQFVYAAVFGFSISCFASLRSILVVELLGLERLTNAFGLLLLFQGVAATIGAPIAGAFMDATGSYDASFYLSGALITLSAVMCYPIGWINAWEKRKQSQQISISETV